MYPQNLFQYCPGCGARLRSRGEPALHCRECGFYYYFNPSCAAAAFVLDDQGRALFIRRAKEPGKGKLALPGGFIDFNEPAETALRREMREEVGLELAEVRFLCSFPNEYFYKGVTYRVLDLFFVAAAAEPARARALDEVESLLWIEPEKADAGEIAFPSMKMALERFCALMVKEGHLPGMAQLLQFGQQRPPV